MSSTRLALIAIFVLTLATRFAYYESNPRPLFGPWPWGGMAHNIVADGHWFELNANQPYTNPIAPTPSFNNYRLMEPADVDFKYADTHPRWIPEIAEPPGEAAVLAGLWEVTGSERYLPDLILRVLLDAFAALLVYRIAMRLFKRRRAALLAATLYALYPPVAETVVNPNADFWGIDFTIAILALYLEALASPRPWRWLISCGLVTGLGAYFHPNVLLLPGALALAGITMTGWRSALRQGIGVTAIALLLLVPWTIRNYNDFHSFIPTRIGVGATLWVGFDEIHSSVFPPHADYLIYQEILHKRPDLTFYTPAYDSYLTHRALTVIEDHPLFYLHVIAHRLWLSTLGAVDVEWMHRGTKTPSEYGPGPLAYVVQRPFDLLQIMLMPLLFALAMLSLGFTWVRRKRAHVFLILTVVVTAIPYLILHLEPRYLMPAAFAYMIWVGLGADLLAERLSLRSKARQTRQMSGAAAR